MAAAPLERATTRRPMMIFWPRRKGEPFILPIRGKRQVSKRGVKTMMAVESATLKKAPFSCVPPILRFIWQAEDGKALFIALYPRLKQRLMTMMKGAVASVWRTSCALKPDAPFFAGMGWMYLVFRLATTRKAQATVPRTRATWLSMALPPPPPWSRRRGASGKPSSSRRRSAGRLVLATAATAGHVSTHSDSPPSAPPAGISAETRVTTKKMGSSRKPMTDSQALQPPPCVVA
mmetsp:Transcript_109658/g.354016  ORF Transcript_109658/g.354016 Transcript_109658/m.354016 type:complete len:234 (-) Transcript_109658:832-1533(-)